MLFSIDKNKSFAILKLAMALFIIAVPSIAGFLSTEICGYTLFLFVGALFVIRVNAVRQIQFKLPHLIFMLLLLYAAISFLWISNRSAHFVYMAVICAAAMFFSLASEYFSTGRDEKLARRVMYMLSISGGICSIANIIYWLMEIVPFGSKENFSQGIGNNDFLALFMLSCIIISGFILKDVKKLRKRAFFVNIILMLFVFVMAKSTLVWCLAAMLLLIYAASKKSEKAFFILSLVCAFAFIWLMAFCTGGRMAGEIFSDTFIYGIKSFLGKGGGFWSAKDIFLTTASNGAQMPGLLASLCAASGAIGVLSSVLIFIWVIVQFIRKKTWATLMNLFLTVMIMFIPVAQSLVVIFLWIGLMAYNESETASFIKHEISEAAIKKMYIIMVILVFTFVLLFGEILKLSADKKYKNEKYAQAYELYKTAAVINVFDAQSCRGAAKARLNGGNIEAYYDEAVAIAQKAQKRDKNNIQNMIIMAQLHYACGKYELCEQEYREIAAKVNEKDKYNLCIVEALYKIIELQPKGSGEALITYEKMLEVSEQTENLDYKEKINNIIDKAIDYTKGELNVESEN